MGLSDYKVTASVAVTDIDRARTFYEEALGLEVESADDGAVFYRCAGGTTMHIFFSPHFTAPTTTQTGWAVTGIEGVVEELRANGVEFLDVHEEGIDTDEQNIAHFEGDAKVAYFVDPDRNIHSIGEAPAG